MSPAADFVDRASSLSAELRTNAADWKRRAQSERMRRSGNLRLADVLAERGARLDVEARKLDRMAAETRWYDAAQGTR